MKALKRIFKISTWNSFASWDNISSIGRLKVLNSAYFVFVALPIFVKIFSKVDEIKFKLAALSYSFDLTLPFNWKLLYYSSICLVIANLFYFFTCPKMIRLFPDFEHYLKSGMPKVFLHRELAKYYIRKTGAEHLNDMPNYYKQFTDLHNITGYVVHVALESLRDEERIEGGNFVFTQSLLNYSNWFFRSCTLFFYLAGLALLIWVMIEKTMFTIKYLL
jgi:hypothetical protein